MCKGKYIGKRVKDRCDGKYAKAIPYKRNLGKCKEEIYKRKSATRNLQRENLQKKICKGGICEKERVLRTPNKRRLNVD